MKVLRVPFTRADYLALPEGFPAQLIDGHLVREPAPLYDHQRLVMRLCLAVAKVVGPDRAVPSPVDVPIDDLNVYQPDVAVYREPLPWGVGGTEVPLIAFEVLSPSGARYDRGIKRRKYLETGVAEVWLVDPPGRSIEVHSAKGAVRRFAGSDPARSDALPDLEIAPATLFAGMGGGGSAVR
jgi:Uma2 family endonuclease